MSIHAVLHDLAEAGPDRPALIHGEEVVSRRELDVWSDALAVHLAEAGIRAGSIVPLQLAASPALIAAALGVLKTGAAYAVMDAQWSAERLRRIDEILGGAVAVAAPGRSSGCFLRELEVPDLVASSPPPGWEPAPVEQTEVATVFFTSGSTGEPKAVLSTHDATLRLFVGEGLPFFDEDTVMPHLGSSAWDALPFEVWGPLLCGGVSVLRQERALAPEELRHEITDHGVNGIFFTTSLFNVLVDEDVSAFEGLRVVYVGGEELSAAHAARFLSARPETALFNGYGPAESTCFALTHRVRLDDTRGSIPLGRVVARTGVHVLDGERECGPDEIGELCVSGDGVSPGYLGDEALTAARFVELPVGGRRMRVYRTGDYGSRSADGLFTFAGRRDRELKIRGHRIDAGQIERTAAAWDGVARCAVVPMLGLSGRPESLALAVVPSGDHLDEEGLGAALRAGLPPGWAPDTIVRLAELPLTSHGKLDTAGLHSAVLERSAAGGETDPRDPIEAAFSGVLGGGHVDREASLFDQGGTSLSAVRLCRALSLLTGLSIPASAVINHPSVNEMRAWIAEQSGEVPADAEQAGQAGPSPMTGMQSGLLFQHLAGEDAQNNTHLAWRITGRLDVDRLFGAVQDVHERHPFLHGRYDFVDQATWNHSARPVTIERMELPDGVDALPRLQQALDRPFALFEGEVWRAVLCQVGERAEHLLGLAVHHLAFDGWSVRILVDDLAAAYRARCDGRAAQFPHLVATPADVYAETERIRGFADLEAQRAYWASELAGVPTDAPAPWVSSPPDGAPGVQRIDVTLTPDQTDLVSRRAAAGGGLLPLLLTALGEALADVTGAEDLIIGVPVSQRSTPLLQGTIACLINMMCVRLREAGGGDATARAESAVLSGLRNSDLSLAEIASVSGQAGQQLFQVIGAVQDSPSAELRLDGCVVGAIDLPYTHLAAPLLVELIADDGVASQLRVAHETASVASSTARSISAAVVARLTERTQGRSATIIDDETQPGVLVHSKESSA